MDKLILTPTTVKLIGDKQKNRGRANTNRPGYRNDAGQVYLPPKSPKRLEAWKEKMGVS